MYRVYRVYLVCRRLRRRRLYAAIAIQARMLATSTEFETAVGLGMVRWAPERAWEGAVGFGVSQRWKKKMHVVWLGPMARVLGHGLEFSEFWCCFFCYFYLLPRAGDGTGGSFVLWYEVPGISHRHFSMPGAGWWWLDRQPRICVTCGSALARLLVGASLQEYMQ